MENEMKSKSSIAFIVELFIMFAILLLVITVVTNAFMLTRNESLKAEHLTEAVIAAESTAETVSAAADAEEASALISKMAGAEGIKTDGGAISFVTKYDKDGASGDEYLVSVTLDEQETNTGQYISGTVDVELADTGEKIYTLTTGNYEKASGSDAQSAESGKEAA